MSTPTQFSLVRAAGRTRAVGTTSADGRQRIGGVRRLPGLLRELGLDPDAMLARVGLPPGALDDAEARVNYGQLARLLHEAANDVHCPHLGLLAGQLWHLEDFGLLGDLMRNSRTLGEALRSFTVFHHLYSDSGVVFLFNHGACVEFGYATYRYDGPGVDLMQDGSLAVAANLVRELSAGELQPAGAVVARARPEDTAPWRRAFHVLPRFDAEYTALSFPVRALERPIAGADRVRWEQAWHEAEQAGPGDLVQQVARALRTLLLRGEFGGDAVAGLLAIHRRTLNRRLQDRGTTFREVLDDVRSSVARELLADSNIGLDDIAASLGYAGVSPFMRAFGRWTGETPGQWRRRTREVA